VAKHTQENLLTGFKKTLPADSLVGLLVATNMNEEEKWDTLRPRN
jgi:hypothetical protein